MSLYDGLPTYIECQECGDSISRVTDPVQEQDMARNPQNYIVTCRECAKDRGWL